MPGRGLWLVVVLTAVAALDGLTIVAEAKSESASVVVATVDGEAIGLEEFNAAFVRAARQKFYHGRAPDALIESLKKDVVEELVLSRLLLREADRRRIDVATRDIDERIAAFAQSLTDADDRKAFAEQAPTVRRRLVDEARLRALENTIRAVPDPDERALAEFYAANTELFTEPPRDRVAVILIGVRPSDPGEIWRAAKAKAAEVAAQLAAGAEFGAMARAHSTDPSAANGGDMGYLHRGMLGTLAEEALTALQPGQFTAEPLQLLQGYALLKLLDRQPPRLRALDDVRERAGQLYKRVTSERQWQAIRTRLRDAASVSIVGPGDGAGRGVTE